MKILSLLIVIFFSINSQAFLDKIFEIEKDSFFSRSDAYILDTQIRDRQDVYDQLKKMRETYVKRAGNNLSQKTALDLVGGYYTLKQGNYASRGIYYAPFVFPAILLYDDITDDNRKAKSRHINNKFLRWAHRTKVSMSMLFFLILADRYVSHKGDKKADEFKASYQKYTETGKILTEKKAMEMKEYLKDPENYNNMISSYETYFKELKRFDSFLKDLKNSLEKAKKRLEKLEKAQEASDKL